MSYRVKELFPTLQGEGAHAGRPAVFCRFTGCNLWTGREEHRASAVCRFCDTDFVGTDGPGGGVFATAEDLAGAVAACWTEHFGPGGEPYVVCTGGEPLLQLDAELVDALHARSMTVAIETNGTLPVPAGVDWVCVSPKADADLVLTEVDEVKVVVPQTGGDPDRWDHVRSAHRFVQPMDDFDPERARANIAWAVAYCHAHPRWRLSVQTHKYLDIP
ncbi:MAG: 7-carboxy-7-deazaguanine synthase [Microthrixaceae bacterium]